MRKRGTRRIILITILSIWILIASGRTLFNLSKLITEEKNWYFLTTEQKKEKQFGEKHIFFRFVQKNIPSGSNILFFTNDGMAYYLARYYLYPTTVIWGERQFTEWGNDLNRNFSYVLYFPTNRKIFENQVVVNETIYKKLNEFKYQNNLRGVIYKK